MVPVLRLAAFVAWLAVLLPAPASAQDAPSSPCTLSIDGDGSSSVWVNATGCAGDVIAIEVAGGDKPYQFPAGQGPEVSQPFNVSPCDVGLNGDKAAAITYTAVVVRGPDKGRASAPYSGTMQPPPQPDDAPPTITFSGHPVAGSYVRPGDSLTLNVTATDDVGLTALKVVDPGGRTVIDQQIRPAQSARAQCHARPTGQSVTVEIPTPYVVPQNPPSPVIRFTAAARDTSGHETQATVEYRTEAVWNGIMMIDATGVGPDYTCTTRWRIELWVKTTAKDEVSGTAEGQHAPRLSCTFVGGPDQGGVTSFAVSGSFDGKAFRLHLKGTGGFLVYGVSGLAVLEYREQKTIVLTRQSSDSARGPVDFTGPGNAGGTTIISAHGNASLTCCFSDPGPTTPAKTPPVFLGADDK